MKGFARTTTTTTMSIKTMQTIKKQRNKEIWFKKVFSSSSSLSSLKMNVEDAGWLCWWWWLRRVSLKNFLRHKELHAMWWSKWDKEENKKARNMRRGKQWHSSDWQMGIMVRKKRSRGGSYYAVNLPQPFSSFFLPICYDGKRVKNLYARTSIVLNYAWSDPFFHLKASNLPSARFH